MLFLMPSAHAILANNLRALMRSHPSLGDRDKIAARAGISARTVGYMLQSGEGNSTLANIEAVAQAFRIPVWQLLTETSVVEKLDRLNELLGAPDSRPAMQAANSLHERAAAPYGRARRKVG